MDVVVMEMAQMSLCDPSIEYRSHDNRWSCMIYLGLVMSKLHMLM